MATLAAEEAVDELGQRLFAERGLLRDPRTVTRLEVTVHRATNLEVPAVSWAAPCIAVTLGSCMRQSPPCQGGHKSPAFGWRTELRFAGVQGHLTFEVLSGSSVLGACFVPLAAILREATFRRALPLLRHGRARRGEEPDDPPSELFVEVSCAPPEADGRLEAAVQRRRADEVRQRYAQLRVALREMELEPAHAGRKPTNIHPYVRASVGVQTRITMSARTSTQRDAEDFVFVPPNRHFLCGDLMQALTERYEGPPVPRRRGSAAVPAYRKRVNGGLRVVYRDLWFVFWYTQHSSLELDVFDDNLLQPDVHLASASVDLQELLLREGAREQPVAPGPARFGSLRVPLRGVSLAGEAGGANIVGTLELDVEFLNDPLALPSPLEGLLRSLGAVRKRSATQHAASMSALQAALASGQLVRELSSFAEQLPHVCNALAVLVTTAAITGARRALQHEEDAADLCDRLAAAVRTLAAALGLPGPHLAELLAEAEGAVSRLSLEQAAEAYRAACTEFRVAQLVPLAGLLAELLGSFGGCGATLRVALLEAATAAAGGVSDGRRFLELMERHLVMSVDGMEVPTLPPLDPKCHSAAELAAIARDLADDEVLAREEDQLQGRPAQSSAWLGFLPSVEPSRVFGLGPRQHPGDVEEIVPDAQGKVLALTTTTGLVAGLLGGFSTVATAKMIHALDDKVLCNPKYHGPIGICQALCKVAKESTLDELLANKIATRGGFVTFFLLYCLLFGRNASERLHQRYATVREVVLEPLGPPHSLHAVVCASGLLTSHSDIYAPWEVDPDSPWTYGQVFAVRFETEALLRLGRTLVDVRALAMKSTLSAASLVGSVSNPVSMSQWALDHLLAEFDEIFDVACLRAAQAGRLLARQLAHASAVVGGPPRPVSLLGFSTGCMLVHECLRELKRLAETGEAPAAADLVCDVVLLGAPVSEGDREEWAALRQLVSGRFVNGFHQRDLDLMSYRGRRSLHNFAGCKALSQVPGVENVQLDDFVTVHAEYAQQTPAILAHLMQH